MIKGIHKIKEEVGYGEESLNELGADYIVFSYVNGGYDGSGFLVGKKGDKYFYHEMGHCSCNGPLDGIENSAKALLSLANIKEIVDKSYGEYGKDCITFIEENEG